MGNNDLTQEHKTRQKRHDTQWLIAGLFGIIAAIVGFALRDTNDAAWLILVLGVALTVGGFVMRGRPVR